MTPELAAEKAADILDLATDEILHGDIVENRIAIADAWMRLHTALANAPKTIEPALEGMGYMVIEGAPGSACLCAHGPDELETRDEAVARQKWLTKDRPSRGPFVACALVPVTEQTGLADNPEPVPVLKTDGETVFQFHGERWCVVASSFRHNDGGGESELLLRIVPEGQPERPDDVVTTFP